jgi:hypothetical protein
MPRQTALIVEVPEAERAVGDLRLRHDSSAAAGVPAHITILYPFVDGDDVDEQALADLFSRFRAFDFMLDRIERWQEGIVWLHPEPSLPFVDLTAAVEQRWPSHPPYEGMFDEPIPHVTVSETPIDFQPRLPIAARARAVTLIERDESSGRWSTRRTFPFAE